MSININLNAASGIGTTYATSPTPVYLFSDATFDGTSSDNNAVDSIAIALGTHTSSMTLALDATTAALASSNGLSVSYVNGTLTVSGTNKSDTLWQTILRGVTFSDSSPTPSDPGSVTVTGKNGGHTGTDTQDLHLDPPPSNFAIHTDADAFSSSSYGLNTGTDNWAGSWTESDTTTTSPSTGDIRNL